VSIISDMQTFRDHGGDVTSAVPQTVPVYGLDVPYGAADRGRPACSVALDVRWPNNQFGYQATSGERHPRAEPGLGS
jgi:hypothetical protein